MKKYFPSFPSCFACGKENSIGVQLYVYKENGDVQAEFKPKADYCGFPGIVHGGISCTVLDEIMWWAAYEHAGKVVVTGEITIRLSKPLLYNKNYLLSAKVTEDKKRYLLVTGAVQGDGNIYCKATGKYFFMSKTEDEKFKNGLRYQDSHGRIIPEELRYHF